MNSLHFTKNKYYKDGETYYIILNIPKDIPFEISAITVKYRCFKDPNNNKICNDVGIINKQIPDDIIQIMLEYFIEIKSFILILEENLELFLSRKHVEVNYFPICSKDINIEVDNFDINSSEYSHVINFTISELNVIIRCNRCLLLSTNYCRNCGINYGITFEPHTHNVDMGHIEFKDCKFVEFESYCLFINTNCNRIHYTGKIDTNYVEKCICGKDIIINKLCSRIKGNEKTNNKKKNTKHDKINLSYVTSKDGSCKHFKKSFRFYIFPCCNSKFECAECHDQSMDHKAQRANKMICGLCFKMQNVGVCCEIKQNDHWNNGKGCRKKLTMNKKDKKKYKK